MKDKRTPEQRREYFRQYREANRAKLAEAQAKYREEHPDKILESSRKYFEKNKDKIYAYHHEYRKEWNKKNREKLNERARERNAANPEASKKRYAKNPTKECSDTKARRLKRQEAIAGRPCPEVCELCGERNTRSGYRIHFDHDHVTGEFRGWLCDRCNTTLGKVNDDIFLLTRMIEYLGPFYAKRAA